MHTIIRRRRVEAKTALPRSSLYAKIKAGDFPPPIRLGPNTVGWIEAEVDSWLSAQIEKSRKAAD
ncbi:MAG: AlpA family transcriptional regulator [Candidatus Nitricoxidivorans perseverans]|uniref:AlpA family transcriptional regulator n=1 Tax=Candidatus Nitricoxidivorans perseverans TaxID=2975601 RepID=A0AA49FNQ9_9PROT|nr:MAG: AlpA family transcriptional regulator [Candidatus Nitricoxidivorans perseverans]